MNRNQRREAHTLKRGGEDAFLCRASGNHLAAQNDEPEPGRCIDCVVTGGPCAPADNDQCSACRALAATFATQPLESATDYARRKARENDARAFAAQLNGSGVRPW